MNPVTLDVERQETMKAHIRTFQPGDWTAFTAFVAEHWGEDHPVLERRLFDWRFAGFGPRAGPPPFRARIVHASRQVIGFLGLVPGRYQVQAAHPLLLAGESVALWLAHPHLRGQGTGRALLDEVERRSAVTVAFRADAETGRQCLERGYATCHRLARHVAPLVTEGYRELCVATPERGDLDAWTRVVTEDGPLAPSPLEPAALGQLWYESTFDEGRWIIQGLHRGARYWKWCFLDRPGGEYLFFGDPPRTGAIVARVEAVAGRAEKVFRILEIVPSVPRAWSTGIDEELAGIVRRAATWAGEERGCVAVDYRVSGHLLAPTLAAAGLRAQPWPISSRPALSLSCAFHPLFADPPVSNVFWRSVLSPPPTVATRWCFTSSEADLELPCISASAAMTVR